MSVPFAGDAERGEKVIGEVIDLIWGTKLDGKIRRLERHAGSRNNGRAAEGLPERHPERTPPRQSQHSPRAKAGRL